VRSPLPLPHCCDGLPGLHSQPAAVDVAVAQRVRAVSDMEHAFGVRAREDRHSFVSVVLFADSLRVSPGVIAAVAALLA